MDSTTASFAQLSSWLVNLLLPNQDIRASSMNLHVPQEILGEIVHHLWDNKASLKACSIANRALSTTAQRLLFSRIVLRGPVKPERLPDIGGSSSNFKRLLEESPHIADYVRYLEVFDLDRSGIFRGRFRYEDTTMIEWISKDEHLPQCLGHLRNLEAFVVQRRQERRSLSQALISALLQLFKQPSLKYIDLYGLPIMLLRHELGCNVRHIALYDDIDDRRLENLKPHSTSLTPPYLASLYLDHNVSMEAALYVFVEDPPRRVDSSRLKRLGIHLSEGATHNHPLVSEFLHVCCDTLEEFSFHPSFDITDPDTASDPRAIFDLKKLHSLKKFYTYFQATHDSDLEIAADPFPWFIRLLENGSSCHNNLAEMIIHVDYTVQDGTADVRAWKDVADVLAGSSFHSLKKLDIYIGAFDHARNGVAQMIVNMLRGAQYINDLRRSKRMHVRVHCCPGVYQKLYTIPPNPAWQKVAAGLT